MPRIYDSSTTRKHKDPGGWASLCPKDLDQETAQLLLENGVEVGRSIYNVLDDMAYCAKCHHQDSWHGYPIPWSELPAAAVKALVDCGLLDSKVWKKAVRKNWGSEFTL